MSSINSKKAVRFSGEIILMLVSQFVLNFLFFLFFFYHESIFVNIISENIAEVVKTFMVDMKTTHFMEIGN